MTIDKQPPFAACSHAAATVFTALSAMLLAAFLFAPDAAAVTSIRVLSYKPNDPSPMFFEPHCNIKLNGTIKVGDLELAKKALDKLRGSPLRSVRAGDDRKYITGSETNGYYALCLASAGGDIQEALRIGELFSDGWMTVVEEYDSCESACAILFMIAKRRSRVFAPIDTGPANRPGPGRYLHWSAKLGFHAPSLVRPEGVTTELTNDTVTQAYALSLETLKSIMFKYDAAPQAADAGGPGSGTSPAMHDPRGVGDIIDDADFIINRISGSQLGLDFIPNDLILALVAVPPGEMFYPSTIGQLLRWGIEPFGFAEPRYISERMLITGCAHLSYLQCLQGGALARCERLGSSRAYFNARYDLRDKPGEPEASNPPDVYFRDVEKFFVTSKRRLWPTPGATDTVEAWGFSLTRASLVPASSRGADISHRYCSARLAWRDGKLAAFELAPFNGQRFPGSGSNLRFTAEDAAKLRSTPRSGWLTAPYETNSIGLLVRPWVMLPEDRHIADLGTLPWMELEKDGPLSQAGPSVTVFLNQAGENPTDTNQLTVDGIADPAATIQLLDEASRPVSAAVHVDEHGFWSASLPISHGSGDYVVRAQASDAAGQTRLSRPAAFTVAAPAVAAVTAGMTSVTWFNNTYVEGDGDLLTARTASREACAEKCLQNANCVALEFYRPQRKCSLFSVLQKKSPDDSADVAVISRPTNSLPTTQLQWFSNTFVEGDGDLLTVRNLTRQACADKCLADQRCVAIEYYKPERKCSHFSTLKPRQPDRSADVAIVHR